MGNKSSVRKGCKNRHENKHNTHEKEKEKEIFFSVLFIGEKKTGKTNIINRLCGKEFTDEYEYTIGVDIHCSLQYNANTLYKIRYFDLSSHDKYAELENECFHSSDVVCLIFDINLGQNSQYIEKWIRKINTENKRYLVVGNKIDLDENYLKYNFKHKCHYTSAKKGDGIDGLLNQIIKMKNK
jgi:small GTP-binding protein